MFASDEPPGTSDNASASEPVQNGLWSSVRKAFPPGTEIEDCGQSRPGRDERGGFSVGKRSLERGENGQGLEKKLARLPFGEVKALLIEPRSPADFFGVVGAFFLLDLRRRGELICAQAK